LIERHAATADHVRGSSVNADVGWVSCSMAVPYFCAANALAYATHLRLRPLAGGPFPEPNPFECGLANPFEPFPERPRYMRRAKYERLRSKAKALQSFGPAELEISLARRLSRPPNGTSFEN
jgi:hypothetical protein